MHHFKPAQLALAAALLLAGCGAPKTELATAPKASVPAVASVAASAQPTAAATNSVAIRNFEFQPAVITVPVGTTVTWTNKDVEQHTVTARDKSFGSDAVEGDKTFTFAFDKAGRFDYFCQIHPHMTGTVVVTDK